METCERCGAEAIDATGRCRQCGWQTAPGTGTEAISSPSLAATRAVDTPDPARPMSRAGTPPASGFDRTMDLPMALGMPPAQPPVRATRVPATAAVQTARFCGVCGARIAGGEAFCGQCGTPIAQATGEFGAAYPPHMEAPSRYRADEGEAWSEAGPDDHTEAYIPAPLGVSRPGAMGGAPYGPGAAVRGYNGPTYADATRVSDQGGDIASTRRTRIIVGLVCIAGGLASAAGAIIVALAH